MAFNLSCSITSSFSSKSASSLVTDLSANSALNSACFIVLQRGGSSHVFPLVRLGFQHFEGLEVVSHHLQLLLHLQSLHLPNFSSYFSTIQLFLSCIHFDLYFAILLSLFFAVLDLYFVKSLSAASALT